MVPSILHERPGVQAGLSTRHAGAMQSSSVMPFVFLNALPDVAQHFVGWFWLQTHAELMISDNCQQRLEDLFPGQLQQFQVQLWHGLFSFTCVILGWSTQKLLCQRCAFHWTAPRSGASADLTISRTLPSAGHEWRWWIKLISVPTLCCLLSTLKALLFADRPLTSFQSKNEPFLQIQCLVYLMTH